MVIALPPSVAPAAAPAQSIAPAAPERYALPADQPIAVYPHASDDPPPRHDGPSRLVLAAASAPPASQSADDSEQPYVLPADQPIAIYPHASDDDPPPVRPAQPARMVAATAPPAAAPTATAPQPTYDADSRLGTTAVSISTAPAPARAVAPALALPPAQATTTPAPGAPVATGADGTLTPTQPVIHNPFGRDIDLTMELTYNKRELGELPVTLTRDNRIFVHAVEFSQLIAPLLSAAGQKAVAAVLDDHPTFEPSLLLPAGVTLLFDPAGLAVVILKIDPKEQSEQRLYDTSRTPLRAQAPATFSAYTTLNVATTYATGTGVTPYIDLQGVAHYGSFVLESEFTGQNLTTPGSLTNSFQFDRDYIRLVYDQPQSYQRFYIGDLSPQFRGEQAAVGIGGVGVLRETRMFDPGRVATLSNTQQLVLEDGATVDILRNGSLIQQLHLDAGSYNLNSLPLTAGSNNIQIQVHGMNGLTQTLDYSTYLDPIDLLPGDYEYGAYVGALSSTLFNTPQYTDKVAFTGFYRKAFLNSNAFGVGVQADSDTQMGDGEYRYTLPGGSRLEFQGALSHTATGGMGGSLSIGYDWVIHHGALLDALNLSAIYNTPRFATLGVSQAIDPQEWTLSGSYSHSFNPRLVALANVFVSYDRVQKQYDASATAEVEYQLSRRWQFTLGVSYQNQNTGVTNAQGLPTSGRGQVGAVASIVWRPDNQHRVEADYDGSRDTESLSLTKNQEDTVGSYGYSAILQGEQDQVDLNGEFQYNADRFDLDVSADTNGTSFNTLTSERSVTARIGTSLAFVDGHFAIGPPITDSFLIAYPHPSLEGRSVIVGDDLENGQYKAASGLLGPALYSYLTSYTVNTIHYDVVNPPTGYDVGTGVEQLRPTYHSGFILEVGAAGYISAAGTLVDAGGKPVSLVSGHITAVGDPKTIVGTFFTNSVGRFAIEDLKPGVRYRVDLNTQEPVWFAFETPKKGTALVDLKTVQVNLPTD